MKRIKNLLKFLYYLLKPDYQGKEDPVFIIGTNRSGTSIVTYMLAQNPALEGIFTGEQAPSETKREAHTVGYCESYHIWSWLNSPNSVFFENSVDSSYWCHPKYIKDLYMEAPASSLQAKALRSSVQHYRKTNKAPLIKDQFNLLRIGLLKALFPQCKVVLVFRDYEDFIKSCSHKWFQVKNLEQPRSIGIQWLTGNLTAYFDAKYFKTNFFVVNYNELLESEEKAKTIFSNLTSFLGIPSHNYDLKKINKNYRFSQNAQVSPFDFKTFDPIINLEIEQKA